MALEYYFIFITVLFSLNYEYDVNTVIQKGSNVLHFIFLYFNFFYRFRFEVGGIGQVIIFTIKEL